MSKQNQHLGFRGEPIWVLRSRMRMAGVPAIVRPWLVDEGSLTRRLTQACADRFHVEVLYQGWQRPMINEAMRLGLPLQQQALIRMVLLYCGNIPRVFARTVIPYSTLRGPLRFLSRLGNRPLGAVLFADPGIQREEMELAQMDRRHSLFHMAMQGSQNLVDEIWGRRSVFQLQGARLLVNEIFLPEILPHPGHGK